jgi:endogenous inhibitor of DNA gyrase (YacG/DUF329 family)
MRGARQGDGLMSDSPANDNAETKRAPVCPNCGRKRSAEHSPFCSRRCADVDLHRWLNGAYVIAGRGAAVDEDESDAYPATRRNDPSAKN